MRNNELTRYLKFMRLKSSLTQTQIAKELGYSSPQFVSNWERGLTLPPLKTVRRLIKILSLDADKVSQLYLKQSRKELEAIFLKELRGKN